MKVLLFCAKAFETMEFSVFIDVMGWARETFGNDVCVHTCGFGKTVISTFGVPVQMDVLIDEVNVSDYDALAIPGGFREFGFNEEAFHPKTLEMIRTFHEQRKPIATVCVAAFALAESGILKGKKATVYHLDGGKTQEELAKYEVKVINEPVVVDQNIITSSCPRTAVHVAFKLLEMLIGTEKMQKVKYAMGGLWEEQDGISTIDSLCFTKTDGKDPVFAEMCSRLDAFLNQKIGVEKQQQQYNKYNQCDDIHDVMIVFHDKEPVGCGAYKPFDEETVELKRIYVEGALRGLGIGKELVRRLEEDARRAGFHYAVLETGRKLTGAVKLYQKMGYEIIPNYGQYVDMPESICMSKKL